MPLYEYKCPKCDYRFEVLHAKPSDTPKKCPNCKAASPQKQFSSFAVGSAGAAECGLGQGAACSNCRADTCPYGDDD